jgi:hypothetical protein
LATAVVADITKGEFEESPSARDLKRAGFLCPTLKTIALSA